MKKKYSPKWKASKQPRKQRKYKANAPLHTKHKFLSAPLSKTLREKHSKRNIPLRKGDEVLVMRGSFKKKKAKISTIDMKRTRIALENIQRTKKDGTKVNVWFHPSSVQIQTLTLDDKERIKALERGKKAAKQETKEKPKVEKTESKPKEEKNVPEKK